MNSRSDDAAALLSQIRTAAEARWPGQRIEVETLDTGHREWVASVIVEPRGSKRAVGVTERTALERLLAEVRR